MTLDYLVPSQSNLPRKGPLMDSPVAHPTGLPPLPLADQTLGGPWNLPAPQSAKLGWGLFLKMLLCWIGPTFRAEELISTGDGSVPLLFYQVLAFRQGPSRSPGLSTQEFTQEWVCACILGFHLNGHPLPPFLVPGFSTSWPQEWPPHPIVVELLHSV